MPPDMDGNGKCADRRSAKQRPVGSYSPCH
jgi:hypothetical protein